MVKRKKLLLNGGWKTYFSKDDERKVFFVLTLVMLFIGILSRIGLF